MNCSLRCLGCKGARSKGSALFCRNCYAKLSPNEKRAVIDTAIAFRIKGIRLSEAHDENYFNRIQILAKNYIETYTQIYEHTQREANNPRD